MSTARPTSREVAEQVYQYCLLHQDDGDRQVDAIAQALDNAWKQGMEDAGRIISSRSSDWFDDKLGRELDVAAIQKVASGELCSDCPPTGYPIDKTRCGECPLRMASSPRLGKER